MKLIAILVLLFAFVSIDATSTTYGTRTQNETYIKYFAHVEVPNDFLLDRSSGYVYRDVVHRGKKTIKCIEVVDWIKEPDGAISRISRGGIGRKHVTVQLQSQKNKPINSTVNVYLRKMK